MDAKELAKKEPMAMPGFTTITPKSEPDRRAETEYDKKIQEEQEKQMTGCCGDGYRRHAYDDYGYKPRPSKNPSPVNPESVEPKPASEPQHVLPTDKKNSKR
jgi:hypothetical protein